MMGKQSFSVYWILALTLFFWASEFVGIQIGLLSYSPGALALFRFIIASICMVLMYIVLPDQKKIPWIDRLQLALLGILGIAAYNLCLNYGERSVSAGITSFIIGLMPVFIVLLSMLMLRERPGLAVYIGIVISLLGLALIVIAENNKSSSHFGLLLILMAALMGAIYTVIQKHFLNKYHPVVVTAWVVWGGTLSCMVFFPHLLQEMDGATVDATLAVVYLGIFPAAFTYVGWSYVLHHLPASTVALSIYASPMMTTLLGFLLLGEQPSCLSLLGGLVALLGALYATLRGAKAIKNAPRLLLHSQIKPL